MLQFNELRITPDRKYLVIDVQVQPLDYYENIVVDTIVIDTQKTFSETGPSSKPFMTIDCEGAKHVRKFIDIDTLADNLFFVYAIASGEPAEDTPCGMSGFLIMGVAYDKYPIYLQGMKLLNEIGGCEPARNLIDYILQRKAFDISLQTGNYAKAIEYWNAFYNVKERSISNFNCGCHGRAV